jgi:hypothetical protein
MVEDSSYKGSSCRWLRLTPQDGFGQHLEITAPGDALGQNPEMV